MILKYFKRYNDETKKTKPYDEYDDETKEGVELMLCWIKEVLVGDARTEKEREELYNFVLRWIKTVVKGGKNKKILQSCAYKNQDHMILKNFLMNYVLIKGFCVDARDFLNKGVNENTMFVSVSCLTDKYHDYYDKYFKLPLFCFKTPYVENNYYYTGTYLLEGRNIVDLPIKERCFLNQEHKYIFYEKVFKDEVGEAFESYLIDKVPDYTTKFLITSFFLVIFCGFLLFQFLFYYFK